MDIYEQRKNLISQIKYVERQLEDKTMPQYAKREYIQVLEKYNQDLNNVKEAIKTYES